MFEIYKLTKIEKRLFKIDSIEKERIDVSKSIHQSNRSVLWVCSLMLSIVFAAMLILSFILENYEANRFLYILETSISLGAFITCSTILKDHPFATQAIIYTSVSALYCYGIHVGIIAQQDNYAVTACLFLAILPLLYVVRPVMIFIFSTVWMIITNILLLKYKTGSVLVVDLTDVLFSWFMGVGIGFTICRLKIENFIHQRQIAIERDFDGLTGLLNKVAFEKKVTKLICGKETDGAFLIMDLDNFKSINDEYGHSQGDQILVEVSRCISGCFGQDAVLGRFGGDEFVFFIPNSMQSQAEEAAHKLLKFMHENVKIGDDSIKGSIGIAMQSCISEKDYDRILIKADKALYATKEQGRFGYTVYSESDMKKRKIFP